MTLPGERTVMRRQRGTALAEVAVVVSFTLIMLFGILQFVLLGYYQIASDAAVFFGAHQYALGYTSMNNLQSGGLFRGHQPDANHVYAAVPNGFKRTSRQLRKPELGKYGDTRWRRDDRHSAKPASLAVDAGSRIVYGDSGDEQRSGMSGSVERSINSCRLFRRPGAAVFERRTY